MEIELWYSRYGDAKDLSIEDSAKWSLDEAFMDSDVLVYYFEKPLEAELAYREWIGTYKQITLKHTLFFIKIDDNKFLALPSLHRK